MDEEIKQQILEQFDAILPQVLAAGCNDEQAAMIQQIHEAGDYPSMEVFITGRITHEATWIDGTMKKDGKEIPLFSFVRPFKFRGAMQ